MLAVASIGMICACLWLAFRIDAMLAQFDQIAPMFANQHRGTIVLLGLVLGFKLGFMFQGSVFTMISCLTYDDRPARILYAYVREQPDRQSRQTSDNQPETSTSS